MNRPAVGALIFLIFGILFGRYFTIGTVLFLGLAAITFLGLLYYRFPFSLILPLFCIAGYFLIVRSVSPANPAVESAVLSQTNEEAIVDGVVYDVSYTKTSRQKITIKTLMINTGGDQFDDRMYMQVYLPEGAETELGQRLKLHGEILTLDFARNPGAYDEFNYLRGKKIQYKMFARSLEKYGVFLTPTMYVKKLGELMGKVYDRSLPARYAGIMKAMITGDQSGLNDSVKELYRHAGIYHIVSVSGLHVVALSVFLKWLLDLFKTGIKKQGIIIIIILILYAIFTGGGDPTMRAVIMGIIAIVAGILKRDNDMYSSTAVSAIILLLYEPLNLWDIGFIYSFGLILGLLIGTDAFKHFFDGISNKSVRFRKIYGINFVNKNIAGIFAAFFAALPIGANFFYYVTPASLLANFLILPTVFLLLVVGFAMGFLGLISIHFAKAFSLLAGGLLWFNDAVCEIAIKLPFSVILTGRPHWLITLFYVILLISFYTYMKSHNAERKFFKKLFCVSSLGFVVTMVTIAFIPKEMEVAFLDVGQGDSVVVSKGRKAVIIDGGGIYGRKTGYNTGSTVLMPYLDYKGIQKAEAAFVTHNDLDHAEGIIELLQEGRAKRLFLSEASRGSNEIYLRIIDAAKKGQVPVSYIKSGDEFVLAEDIFLSTIHPTDKFQDGDNNSSIVLKLVHNKNSFLFTGDIEREAEGEIDSSADILKVAHHGSSTSSGNEFLKRVDPYFAIISCGRDNMHGHPHTEVVNALIENTIPFYTTAEKGAVVIYSNGQSIRITSMGDE